MKLYKQVLIETAEQAEALPVGTIARADGSDGEPTHACLRMANGWWCTDETNDDGTPFLVPHVGMVGDMALVPIEAEEETRAASRVAGVVTAEGIEFTPRTGIPASWETRYTTEWEEA